MDVLEAKEICYDFIVTRMEQKAGNIPLSKELADKVKPAIQIYIDYLLNVDESDGAMGRAIGLTFADANPSEFQETDEIAEYQEFPILRAIDLEVLQGIQRKLRAVN